MNKLKIYLSGAIKNVNEQFQNWRNTYLDFEYYENYPDIHFIDPNTHFNYTNKLLKTDKQCIDLFMWFVDKCDVLLVNLDYSSNSCGTCMEIERAYCHSIPIIAFGSKPKTWYIWAKERSSVIFDTMEDALEYINNSYCDLYKTN